MYPLFYNQLNDYQNSLISIFHSFADNIIKSGISNYGNSEQYSVDCLPSLRWKLLSRGYLVNPAVVKLEKAVQEETPFELVIESRDNLQCTR